MNTPEKIARVSGYALGAAMRPGLKLTIIVAEVAAGIYIRGCRKRHGR